MYTASAFGVQRNIGAVLAAAIVAASGLVFDRAHLAAAPAGIVEIGQLSPVEALPQMASLPEVVVIGTRA
jgi:hypothetical protein